MGASDGITEVAALTRALKDGDNERTRDWWAIRRVLKTYCDEHLIHRDPNRSLGEQVEFALNAIAARLQSRRLADRDDTGRNATLKKRLAKKSAALSDAYQALNNFAFHNGYDTEGWSLVDGLAKVLDEQQGAIEQLRKSNRAMVRRVEKRDSDLELSQCAIRVGQDSSRKLNKRLDAAAEAKGRLSRKVCNFSSAQDINWPLGRGPEEQAEAVLTVMAARLKKSKETIAKLKAGEVGAKQERINEGFAAIKERVGEFIDEEKMGPSFRRSLEDSVCRLLSNFSRTRAELTKKSRELGDLRQKIDDLANLAMPF